MDYAAIDPFRRVERPWRPYSIDGTRVRLERFTAGGRLEYKYEEVTPEKR